MTEIKLTRRYPDSRPEDITDAYMRGVDFGRSMGHGTCYVRLFDDGVDEDLTGQWVQYEPPRWFLSCGHEVEGSERPNYCPSCGKKVRA